MNKANSNTSSQISIDLNISEKRRIEIAARLKELRKNHNFTLDQLADILHYTKPTVQKWERKANPQLPTSEQLYALHKLYGVTPSYLLCCSAKGAGRYTTIEETVGLPKASINVLSNLFAQAMSSPDSVFPIESECLLAFINHFIQQAETLSAPLADMIRMQQLKEEYNDVRKNLSASDQKRLNLLVKEYQHEVDKYMKSHILSVLSPNEEAYNSFINKLKNKSTKARNSTPIKNITYAGTEESTNDQNIEHLIDIINTYKDIISPIKATEYAMHLRNALSIITEQFISDCTVHIENYNAFSEKYLKPSSSNIIQ